jgi:hypothetical protein
MLARLDRWWRHRVWHSQYPELYWRTHGNRSDPEDFIRCPFCHREYRAKGK